MTFFALPLVASQFYIFHGLFSRKKKWFKSSVNWLVCLLLALIAVFIFFWNGKPNYEIRAVVAGMVVPIIFLAIDYLFTQISFAFQGRNMNLFLRFSDEYEKSKFGLTDKILSFILLAITTVLPITILIISAKLP